MSPVVTAAAEAIEIALLLAGMVLLWRHVVSPYARARRGASPLPPWEALPSELLLLLLFAVAGILVAGFVAAPLLKSYPQVGDARTIVGGGVGQIGMVAGVLLYAHYRPAFRKQADLRIGPIIRTGAVTFVISLPILVATSKAWEVMLQLFGLPAERQDLIRMFAETKSPRLAAALLVLAVVVAPVGEELVFRAGLFRFLRTRAPRALALLLPAVIFAALHVNWITLEGFASFAPLLVLALVYSFAYERTGHIGTTMIAHALFNLNTVLLIYARVAIEP